MSNSLQLHGLQHARLPCPSPTPGVYSNSCPSRWWCHPTVSSSVIPFSSCLQSFPASGSFQMRRFFACGGQSIGVSASTSVLPVNIQDWFPLGLTGLISLQSKGLSRVFYNTTVWKHQFFGAQLYSPALTSMISLLVPWNSDLTYSKADFLWVYSLNRSISIKLVAASAKSLQACPTLCDPIESSSPGSAVSGILQARTLEWVAISFSNAWKWKVKVKSLSRVRLFSTTWTAAYQTPPSMGFSRQEYWSGVPLPSPSNLLRMRISAPP